MKLGADSGGCFPTGRHYPGIAHLLRIEVRGTAAEHDGQTPLGEVPLAGIDTETTGRDPGQDRIVEIAVVRWHRGAVVSRRSWLVNPGVPIPAEARDVHGIGDDDVRDRPALAGVVDEVLEAMGDAVPVAYNADFDKRMFLAELARMGLHRKELPPAARRDVEWIDAFVWAAHLLHDEKKKTLVAICEKLGIPIENAHRATDDAEAALRVMQVLAEDERVPRTYAALVLEQGRLARAHAHERAMWRGASRARAG